MNKFIKYYTPVEKQKEMSEYVHLNFKLIMTKMTSEMRRKLDIEPDLTNQNGYLDLMVSLQGRMFNEMIYSLCGVCQSTSTKFETIVPRETIILLLELMKGQNPLKGKIRDDVPDDLEGFKKFYLSQVQELRSHVEALPK